MPAPALELLRRRGHGFDMHDSDEVLPPADLRRAITGRQGVVCIVLDRIDAAFFDAAGPSLRVVSTVSVGHEQIDLSAARARGVAVGYTPGVLSDTTADLAFALLMAVARRVVEHDRFLRAGRWKRWAYFDFWGADVHGATLGIIGGGGIGSAMARRGSGFDMRILCHTRGGRSSRMPEGTRFVDLPTLLRESDFVSIHAPLTAETRHLVGAKQLALMKPSAFLINTSRGALVDETALVDALRRGVIAGAGLDVFEHEPRVPAELLAMENVVLLPHTGSASRATREKMACLAASAVADVLEGRTPPNLVPLP